MGTTSTREQQQQRSEMGKSEELKYNLYIIVNKKQRNLKINREKAIKKRNKSREK